MIFDKIKTKVKSHQSENSRYIVSLDVGTEFVKALIGRVKGDAIEIIGVGRTHQELADMHSGAIADISAVVANCENALTQAEKQAGVSARQTVIGVAGELVKGTNGTIRYKRANPEQEITLDEMEYIVKKVQERAQKQARKQLNWELGINDVDIRMVNSAIVSIQIDGYKVSNPIGFQGRDVAIQLYTAFAPMIHIGALERTATDLDLDLIAIAAEPFAVARSVIGDDASSNFSAVLIDVGGGTTDIAVVNDGGVEGTKMFGIGGRSFTKSIASELNLSFGVAEELKLRLSSGKLEKSQEEAALRAVQKTLAVWLSGVELALSEFESLDRLPTKILLCGGGASLKALVDALKQKQWHINLPFSRQPDIQYIQPEQVIKITDATGKVTDHSYITPMGLLRVGHDTIQTSNDTSDSITEKLNRMLRI